MTRDEFIQEYGILEKRATFFSVKSLRDGLLALEEFINHDKADNRDIFEYGIRFVVDGIDWSYIDIILSNIIEQEKDEYTKLLKTIKKQAVKSIQAGVNINMIGFILNSFTDLSLNKDKFLKEAEKLYISGYTFQDEFLKSEENNQC